MSTEKSRCGFDSNKCIDWTTTRRHDYKPGPNESIDSKYTSTRTFNGTGKSSKNNSKINKSESKKKSTIKTNKTVASSKRSAVLNKSKSMKHNITSNTSMTKTNAAQSSVS
ncbi:unnamed protein product [Rotaria sp. Silwood2]|nr:unnamed protein product [Rotaria sp. Silwood2]CAF2499647.1 unnamed protein product [Rotaria sp. Silwood2]CAF2729930.1 unnamed protein product [Rotaria sp. Silwood2]CAF2963648.1 unnamed protein product [Rotaria sp. Silwood2]CAF4012012.1 unnamed protein product [Rotaria sp. Silwood2]